MQQESGVCLLERSVRNEVNPDLLRMLGYPEDYCLDSHVEAMLFELVDWFTQNVEPKVWAWELGIRVVDREVFFLEDQSFSCRVLANWAGRGAASCAVVFAVSLGAKLDDYVRSRWDQGYYDQAYFVDTYAHYMTKKMIRGLGKQLTGYYHKQAVSPHWSPGYGSWALEQQEPLWQLIGRQEQSLPLSASGGVSDSLDLVSGGMLRPTKSQLGLMLVGGDLLGRLSSGCHTCHLVDCHQRRDNNTK